MSVLTVRGGVPHVFRASADNTAGMTHVLPFMSMYLQLRVTGNPCKLFFSAEAMAADADYILVPVASTSTPYGEWQGPAEIGQVWMKGSGGASAVELVAYQRRG